MAAQTRSEVIRRLKNIEGHVREVIEMMEVIALVLPLYSTRGRCKGR